MSYIITSLSKFLSDLHEVINEISYVNYTILKITKGEGDLSCDTLINIMERRMFLGYCLYNLDGVDGLEPMGESKADSRRLS